jgi:hypothetical protein
MFKIKSLIVHNLFRVIMFKLQYKKICTDITQIILLFNNQVFYIIDLLNWTVQNFFVYILNY